MDAPRLSSHTLRIVRSIAESAGKSLIAKQMRADFHVDAVFQLDQSSRAPSEFDPRPIMARSHQGWAPTERTLSVPSGNRISSRRLTALYQGGQLRPSEVLERLFQQVQKGQFGRATYSPFIAYDIERSMDAALHADVRYREKRPRSPLDGVPLPIKDQHHMQGLVTRGGTRYLNNVAIADGTFIQSLRHAGAILYAKTHTTEWGMTPTGQNPHFRMPRNPYSQAHGAGGSSTGAGVAVALGLASVASGSDGGGSIRIPSALCGVFGLKPTYGRYSRTGDIFRTTVAVAGPLGASTTDIVDFLKSSLPQRDATDIETTYAPQREEEGQHWEDALLRGVDGCVIGVPEALFAHADRAISSAVFEKLRLLEAHGKAVLKPISLPLAEHALGLGVMVIGCESAAGIFDDCLMFRERMSDDLRLSLAVIDTMTATEMLVAMRTRVALRNELAAALREVHVIAMPTVGCLAPSYSLDEDYVAVSDPKSVKELIRTNFIANLTGLPACSVPIGMHNQLPIAMQFVADAWDEASIIAVMAECERLGFTQLAMPDGAYSLVG